MTEDLRNPSDKLVEAVAKAITIVTGDNDAVEDAWEDWVDEARAAIAAMVPFVASADEIRADIIEQVRRTNFDQTFNGALSETLIELFANPIPDDSATIPEAITNAVAMAEQESRT